MTLFHDAALRLLAAGQATCGPQQVCDPGLPVINAGHSQLQQILQIVFGIAAALAVLFIVIAGLRFTLAQGNPQEVGKARATIVYALIGLLIAIIAEAIVSFVLGNL